MVLYNIIRDSWGSAIGIWFEIESSWVKLDPKAIVSKRIGLIVFLMQISRSNLRLSSEQIKFSLRIISPMDNGLALKLPINIVNRKNVSITKSATIGIIKTIFKLVFTYKKIISNLLTNQ